MEGVAKITADKCSLILPTDGKSLNAATAKMASCGTNSESSFCPKNIFTRTADKSPVMHTISIIYFGIIPINLFKRKTRTYFFM